MPESVLPGTLVSAEWLADRLNDPNVAIVDIRGYVKTSDVGPGQQVAEYIGATDEFQARHIPGSVFVDWTTDITDPDAAVKVQVAPPARFAASMAERGIGDDTDVVVVDHTGGHFATRLWWALKYYGHDRAAVLDGGFNHWLDAGTSGYGRSNYSRPKEVHSPQEGRPACRGRRRSARREKRRSPRTRCRRARSRSVHGGHSPRRSRRAHYVCGPHSGQIALQRGWNLEIRPGA